MSDFTLIIIKSPSVGRGDGPSILRDLLETCNISLYKFRPWVICHTTWSVLDPDALPYIGTKVKPSWICLFKNNQDERSSFEKISDYSGSSERSGWRPKHLRYKYIKHILLELNPFDDVVRITDPDRLSLECKLLFNDFDIEDLIRGKEI